MAYIFEIYNLLSKYFYLCYLQYVDSLVPELDLLIIGAYYGKGRRQGCLSHFLLAAAVASEEPG